MCALTPVFKISVKQSPAANRFGHTVFGITNIFLLHFFVFCATLFYAKRGYIPMIVQFNIIHKILRLVNRFFRIDKLFLYFFKKTPVFAKNSGILL